MPLQSAPLGACSLQKRLRESEGNAEILEATPMSEAAGWDTLSRLEQRALIKLFGGGSLRREASAVVEHLRAQALVDEHGTLSKRGLLVLTLAIRRQQGVFAQRSMIAK